ncbi:MAG: hypothetical protein HC903_25175 [Methylacidiphilales bacterium]|nr:hypothetical protein [Candidatus Methylacidiphilales bacterium]NJR18371.1 hypothetical protein [Calothrix sp. CSU_2_0]
MILSVHSNAVFENEYMPEVEKGFSLLFSCEVFGYQSQDNQPSCSEEWNSAIA